MKSRAKYVVTFGLMVPTMATAVGLGELHIQSSLNQPLEAYIDINLPKDTPLSSVKVRLASPEAFQHAGLDRPYSLSKLVFRVKERDGHSVIEISSVDRVETPFLNVLLDVAWANGQFYRAYAVLLDPPGYELAIKKTQPMPVSKKLPSRSVAAKPAALAGTPTTTATKAVPTSAVFYGPTTQKDDLWKIALRYKPQQASIDQVMIAILNANPNAFVGNNINGLRTGVTLSIPDKTTILTVSRAQASTKVETQTKAWQQGIAAPKSSRNNHVLVTDNTPVAPPVEPTTTQVSDSDGKAAPVSVIPPITSQQNMGSTVPKPGDQPPIPSSTQQSQPPPTTSTTVQQTEDNTGGPLFDDFMPVPKILAKVVKEPATVSKPAVIAGNNPPTLTMTPPVGSPTAERSLLMLRQQVQQLELQNQQLRRQLEQTAQAHQFLIQKLEGLTARLDKLSPPEQALLGEADEGGWTYYITLLLCLVLGAGLAIALMRYMKARGNEAAIDIEPPPSPSVDDSADLPATSAGSEVATEAVESTSSVVVEEASVVASDMAEDATTPISTNQAKVQVSVSSEVEVEEPEPASLLEVSTEAEQVIQGTPQDNEVSNSDDASLSSESESSSKQVSVQSSKKSSKDTEDETAVKSTALLQSVLDIPSDVDKEIEALNQQKDEANLIESTPAESDELVRIDQQKAAEDDNSLAFDLADFELTEIKDTVSDSKPSGEQADTDGDYLLDFEPSMPKDTSADKPDTVETVESEVADLSTDLAFSLSDSEVIDEVLSTTEPTAEEKEESASATSDEVTLTLDQDSEVVEDKSQSSSEGEDSEIFTKGVNMATQLALAETYIAMEDWESARASLQEVMDGGTDGQREKAGELLARIKDKN